MMSRSSKDITIMDILSLEPSHTHEIADMTTKKDHWDSKGLVPPKANPLTSCQHSSRSCSSGSYTSSFSAESATEDELPSKRDYRHRDHHVHRKNRIPDTRVSRSKSQLSEKQSTKDVALDDLLQVDSGTKLLEQPPLHRSSKLVDDPPTIRKVIIVHS